jgi:hypothetical protein
MLSLPVPPACCRAGAVRTSWQPPISSSTPAEHLSCSTYLVTAGPRNQTTPSRAYSGWLAIIQIASLPSRLGSVCSWETGVAPAYLHNICSCHVKSLALQRVNIGAQQILHVRKDLSDHQSTKTRCQSSTLVHHSWIRSSSARYTSVRICSRCGSHGSIRYSIDYRLPTSLLITHLGSHGEANEAASPKATCSEAFPDRQSN